MKTISSIFLLSLLSINMICSSGRNNHMSKDHVEKVLNNNLQTELFAFYCSDKDTTVLKEIKKTLEDNHERLCSELENSYRFQIVVEIYPDQESYNEALTDKSVTGSPACSGNRRIQLVSPNSPIRIAGIPYEDRLLMVVHEYVHLMLNEINDSLPIWITEGVASYLGSPNGGYDRICSLVFGQLPEISLENLYSNYAHLSAPDIYSFSAIRFIANHFGLKILNRLIRDPVNLHNILGVNLKEFDNEWNGFINLKYRK